MGKVLSDEPNDKCTETLCSQLQNIHDPQRAWLLLLACINPRLMHFLRTTRPKASSPMAVNHDALV
eukprot:11428830-Karenia_brevis.AAC.1